MSKKMLFPVVAVCSLVFAVAGCHAEAKIGSEPKVATPPPPPPPAPPPPPPAPVAQPVKAIGKAKIVNNEIQIPGKVQFDNDKATIKQTPETLDVLKTLADVMKANAQVTKLRVEGNTDNTGTKAHNQTLSNERADAVAKWLTDNGVDKSRLVTIGFGPDRPIAANDTEANREKNRRTEFKLWEVDGKPTDYAKNDASTSTTATTSATAPTKSGTTTPTTTAATTPKK